MRLCTRCCCTRCLVCFREFQCRVQGLRVQEISGLGSGFTVLSMLFVKWEHYKDYRLQKHDYSNLRYPSWSTLADAPSLRGLLGASESTLLVPAVLYTPKAKGITPVSYILNAQPTAETINPETSTLCPKPVTPNNNP